MKKIRPYLKMIGRFLAMFLLSVVLIYGISIYQQPKTASVKKEPNKTIVAIHNKKLSTKGFARYVGEKPAQLIANYGEPSQKLYWDETHQIWYYSSTSETFFSVLVDQENNKISNILAIGPDLSLKPLTQGLSIDGINDILPIYSKFELTFREEKLEIELSEFEKNRMPLIAFKNGTYGILLLNQKNELVGIYYLDTETLLRQNKYRVISKTPVPYFQSQVDLNKQKISLTQQISIWLNMLRQNNNLPMINMNSNLKNKAAVILNSTLTVPKKVLHKTSVSMLASTLSEQLGTSGTIGFTDDDMLRSYLNSMQITNKQSIFLFIGLHDISDFYLQSFLENRLQPELINKRVTDFGFQIQNNNLLLITQK